MKRIPLTQNKFALVDDADFEWLNRFKWCARCTHGIWYAVRHIYVGRKHLCSVRMHRLILGLKSGNKQQGDHINGNGLDNRRCNLRIATNSQNHANSKKYCGNRTSKYKGVHWSNWAKKWTARIMINYEDVHLGYFSNEGLAARMYDLAAKYYFGDFAKLNFPPVAEA